MLLNSDGVKYFHTLYIKGGRLYSKHPVYWTNYFQIFLAYGSSYVVKQTSGFSAQFIKHINRSLSFFLVSSERNEILGEFPVMPVYPRIPCG